MKFFFVIFFRFLSMNFWKGNAEISHDIGCPFLVGNWSGMSTFYSFSVNMSTPNGNKPDEWTQENLLSFEEQNGCFVRGREWYYTEPGRNLFFVSSFFGVIEVLGIVHRQMFRVRLQEFYNTDGPGTDETLGVLDITIYVKDMGTMYVTYVGTSTVEKRFGAQSFVAQRVE